jgi:[acyl-carrier-protein] S-malonyltransferase
MKAFIFPGQGIQKASMGKDLYNNFPLAKDLLNYADQILGRSISKIMIDDDEIELSKSSNSQPAIFLYEVILATIQNDIEPDLVAGHSFGEFAALVVNKTLKFEDALKLVDIRSNLGFKFSNSFESAMAAVIGLDDLIVENTIKSIVDNSNEKIFIANYNGPGQLVLSGSRNGIKEACKIFKNIGAKRAVILPIEGAFHTPLMKEIELEYSKSISKIEFSNTKIPICQCADSKIYLNSSEIKSNLITHMTSSVNWTKMIHNMVEFGINEFIEIGTDDTLQKIISRMYPKLKVNSILFSKSLNGKVRNYSI